MRQGLLIVTVVLAVLSLVFFLTDRSAVWTPLLLATVLCLVAAVFVGNGPRA